MYAIEMKKVSFSYEEGQQILEETDFWVNYGEITLLCGLSGEGKSTLLSLATGIIPHIIPGMIQGEILVDGQSTAEMTLNEICRKIGVVLQNAESQIIQQLVEDEIAFGCENFAFSREKTKEKIAESCQKMKLRQEWKTRTLSGGQKQRLMTAATLATGQKIVVLDEPLANLDKQGTEILLEQLKLLAGEGYAVLVVEHRIDRILAYADVVWNIRKGKLSKIEDKRGFLTKQAGMIRDECIPKTAEDVLLAADKVGFAVKDREILREVSFQVKKGERVLLLGENGSGKTTLLHLLARLKKPVKGQIRQSLDESLGQKTKGDKRWYQAVGVVYQNPNYQLFMPTVSQEIAFGAVSQAYAEKMMQQFGLQHLAQRHPHSLSEGQKRRVSIAAVMAGRPKLVLLDEPTVGQDFDGLSSLVKVLNEIHEETGNTMITITHDVRCAESLCDTAILLENGYVSQTGGKELVRKYYM